MSFRHLVATVGLGMFILSVAPVSQAEIFVTIKGQRQGILKGDSFEKGHAGEIIATTYDHDIKSPRDPASGLATGKRQHSPITFRMNQGRHTVQLMQALVTGEILTSVVFEFLAPDATGVNKPFRKVTLTNAALSDIHDRAGVAKATWTTDA